MTKRSSVAVAHVTWARNNLADALCAPDPAAWILTHSGRAVHLLEPTPEMIDPYDVAHALARINRWSGHTNAPYSVAQHALMVADHVPIECRAAALLHDASEAFLGDVSAPLKRHMPGYRELEAQMERVIALRFGLQSLTCSHIKWADQRSLATERRDLLPAHPWKPDAPPFGFPIFPLIPELIEVMWLDALGNALGEHL